MIGWLANLCSKCHHCEVLRILVAERDAAIERRQLLMA